MRRSPAVAILALLAAIAAAQVPAGSGKVLEVNNFSATTGNSYINAAQCAGASLTLEWNIIPLTGSFTPSGNFRIYASDREPFTSGDNTNFCPEVSTTTTDPPVNAGQVEAPAANTAVQQEAVPGNLVVQRANVGCDASNEGKVVYICSHWYDATPTRRGYASGTFVVQVQAPAAPTGISVGEGNGRLVVRFEESEGGAAAADHYIAYATPVGGGTTVASPRTNASPATISGLENGTTYNVVVRAFSIGGNPSADSELGEGTPVPGAGFWDVCQDRGCVEQGGCATGSAGALALLSTASLLALRRRKP